MRRSPSGRARAHAADELPELMRRAFQAMRTGKGGPVLVEIPAEVWDDELSAPLDYEPVVAQRAAPDPAALARAAEMLAAAENPVLWAGQGVLYAGASAELAELAELVPAPVVATNPGKSAMPETHPLACGSSTRSGPKMLFEFLRRADLVFAVGSSLTRTPFGPSIPPGKTIVHSTNDADDIHKDYRADHALVGDAKLVLRALIEAVGEIRRANGGARTLAQVSQSVAEVREDWRADWAAERDSDEIPINQYRIIRDLMATIDRDNAILTHDSGSPREQLLPMWETTVPDSYIGWGKSTQLGYSLAVIMGAKLAAPERLCINVMGDAAIGMTGMDLETAARAGIAILTIVLNNGIMAAERDVLVVSDEKYGAMTVGGDYAKVAEGLGVAAARVETPEEFVPALERGIAVTEAGAPFLIECIVKEGQSFSRY